MDWLLFFWYMLKSYLFSTGGMGPLPSLHHDLIEQGWATDRQFTEALAVGQITPGPSGLWVISLGYLVAGVVGSLVAAIAAILPPMLVMLIRRGYARIAHHPSAQGALDGLGLSLIGVGLVILVDLLTNIGIDAGILVILVISTALALSRRLPTPALIALAALAGMVLWR